MTNLLNGSSIRIIKDFLRFESYCLSQNISLTLWRLSLGEDYEERETINMYQLESGLKIVMHICFNTLSKRINSLFLETFSTELLILKIFSLNFAINFLVQSEKSFRIFYISVMPSASFHEFSNGKTSFTKTFSDIVNQHQWNRKLIWDASLGFKELFPSSFASSILGQKFSIF